MERKSLRITLALLLAVLLVVPVAFAGGPVVSHSVKTVHHTGNHRGPAKDKDHHPHPVIIQGGGGGINGPLGKTCAEARERMRWSELPCAPDMPKE